MFTEFSKSNAFLWIFWKSNKTGISKLAIKKWSLSYFRIFWAPYKKKNCGNTYRIWNNNNPSVVILFNYHDTSTNSKYNYFINNSSDTILYSRAHASTYAATSNHTGHYVNKNFLNN